MFDSFTVEEANRNIAVMRDLESVTWAQPLLRRIKQEGGLCGANMPLFFELRLGHALHMAGLAPSYEVPGEGLSTIDYGFESRGTRFLVELMRLGETEAAKAATHVSADGIWFKRVVMTGQGKEKQSPEGETLKAIERICQKCAKFQTPHDPIHILLVDFRTFSDGGDGFYCMHVALGGDFVPPPFRCYWDGRLITGVFDPETNLRGAEEARRRVHFLGFVSEESFAAGDFAAATRFVFNPNIFGSDSEARAVLDAWPLRPAEMARMPQRSKQTASGSS